MLLHKAWHNVLGKGSHYSAQQIGDCESFGHGPANDFIPSIEIALGEPADYRDTDTEFTYATLREVAGILVAGDGSYGAAADTTIDLVSREMLGYQEAYSSKLAEDWVRTGAPSDFSPKLDRSDWGPECWSRPGMSWSGLYPVASR